MVMFHSYVGLPESTNGLPTSGKVQIQWIWLKEQRFHKAPHGWNALTPGSMPLARPRPAKHAWPNLSAGPSGPWDPPLGNPLVANLLGKKKTRQTSWAQKREFPT